MSEMVENLKNLKHKTLTLVEKTEIIKKLENGKNFSDLATFCSTGHITIYDITKSKEKSKDFDSKTSE